MKSTAIACTVLLAFFVFFAFKTSDFDVRERINHARADLGLAALAANTDLDDAVTDFANLYAREEIALPSIRQFLKGNISGLSEMSARITPLQTSGESKWKDALYPHHTHYASAKLEGNRRLSIVAKLLPPLQLPLSKATTQAFYQTCSDCEGTHQFKVRPQHQTSILRCPVSEQPTNLLATTTDEHWQDCRRFLTSLPSNSLSLMDTWKRLHQMITYTADVETHSEPDCWQTSTETLLKKTGDCEDISILLVDQLLANGIEARVAIGTHDGLSHAWGVVKINGQQYILETTKSPELRPLSPSYEPLLLFNRETIYTAKANSTEDYWSSQIWIPHPLTLANRNTHI